MIYEIEIVTFQKIISENYNESVNANALFIFLFF
jgi:hypothetical protein